MNDDSVAGVVWCLTRLHLQLEAVVMALEKLRPGFRNLVTQEQDQLRAQGSLLKFAAENKREVDQVSDWGWLKSEGIDPGSAGV
jgi:hypothetical protein